MQIAAPAALPHCCGAGVGVAATPGVGVAAGVGVVDGVTGSGVLVGVGVGQPPVPVPMVTLPCSERLGMLWPMGAESKVDKVRGLKPSHEVEKRTVARRPSPSGPAGVAPNVAQAKAKVPPVTCGGKH
jgi:hypothetical protein